MIGRSKINGGLPDTTPNRVLLDVSVSPEKKKNIQQTSRLTQL